MIVGTIPVSPNQEAFNWSCIMDAIPKPLAIAITKANNGTTAKSNE